MRLKIYDAMWLLHYGACARRYRDYTFSGYPLGGAKYLAKNIFRDLWNGDRVLVCFDSKTNKNAIYANYKSNRPHNAYIVSQSLFIYNMLMKCGVSSLKKDGLEGDDLIASAVAKYRNTYHNIVIVSNDRDTAHNVFGNVRVEASSADGIDVDGKNFVVAVAREPVYYNTISAYKVLTGDSSDSITSFIADDGRKGKDIYYDFIAFIENNVPRSEVRPYLVSKKELFKHFLQGCSYLTERDKTELDARTSIIFPTLVDVTESPCCNADVDEKGVAKLLSILGEDDLLGEMGLGKVRLSQEEFNEFKSTAQVLRDGTFAVDNDCPVHSNFVLDDFDMNMRLFD